MVSGGVSVGMASAGGVHRRKPRPTAWRLAEADCLAISRLIQDWRQKQVPVDFERRVASPVELAQGYGAGPAVVAQLRCQSRHSSFIEAVTSTVIGFVLSYTAQLVVFPLYGIHVFHSINLQIIGWFTLISVIRGYWVRRLWDSEWWKRKKTEVL